MAPNKFAETVSKLQELKPWEVPANPTVQQHIISLYNDIHTQGGEAFVEREARYINRTIIDDKKKWNIIPLSVFFAFVDLAVKNLTLEPGAQAVCYLLNRSSKVSGPGGKEIWENRAYLSVTGYGEIVLRQRAGQIRHCDSPTVVYDGDDFGYIEKDGRKHVTYGLNLSHNPARPIACFMKITRIDGTSDYAIILPEGWSRLARFSEKQNNGTANALYSSGLEKSIDPGFLIAKCVKHAFKSYPKLPIGKGMVMEADLPEEERMPDYYSMDAADMPGDTPVPDEPESFAQPSDHSEGVTVDPAGEYATDDGTW